MRASFVVALRKLATLATLAAAAAPVVLGACTQDVNSSNGDMRDTHMGAAGQMAALAPPLPAAATPPAPAAAPPAPPPVAPPASASAAASAPPRAGAGAAPAASGRSLHH
jgi:N-acetylmuramoyl-L-alanine amidase